MALNSLRNFLDFLARMGLNMRDDPRRVIDPSTRRWGTPVDGWSVSIEPVRLREDTSVLSNLSVVLRNVSDGVRELIVPGWLFFYRIELKGPDGGAVPMTAFGRELLKPERRAEKMEVKLGPGELAETQIPIGSIFQMSARGEYRAAVECELPDGAVVRSNGAAIPIS